MLSLKNEMVHLRACEKFYYVKIEFESLIQFQINNQFLENYNLIVVYSAI